MDVEHHPLVDPVGEEPSLRRELAHELSDAARMGVVGVANEVVGNVVSFGLVMGLLIVFVPLGLLVLFVAFALLYAVYAVIGPQPGPLGTVIGGTWLALTAAALFLTFRAVLRRLRGRGARSAMPQAPPDVRTDHYAHARERQARPMKPTLAELDAALRPAEPRDSASATTEV